MGEAFCEVWRNAPSLAQILVIGEGGSGAGAGNARGADEDIAGGGLGIDEFDDGCAEAEDAQDLRPEGVGENIGQAFAQDSVPKDGAVRAHLSGKGLLEFVLAARCAEDGAGILFDTEGEGVIGCGIVRMERKDDIGRLRRLVGSDIAGHEGARIGHFKGFGGPPAECDYVRLAVDANELHGGFADGFDIGLCREGKVGLSAAAIDDAERLSAIAGAAGRQFVEHGIDNAEKFVHLTEFCLHGWFQGSLVGSETEGDEEFFRVETAEGVILLVIVSSGAVFDGSGGLLWAHAI